MAVKIIALDVGGLNQEEDDATASMVAQSGKGPRNCALSSSGRTETEQSHLVFYHQAPRKPPLPVRKNGVVSLQNPTGVMERRFSVFQWMPICKRVLLSSRLIEATGFRFLTSTPRSGITCETFLMSSFPKYWTLTRTDAAHFRVYGLNLVAHRCDVDLNAISNVSCCHVACTALVRSKSERGSKVMFQLLPSTG